MYVLFKEAKWDVKRTPKVNHYDGGFNLRYDLQKEWLEINIKNLYLPSYASLAAFIKYMLSWQDDGDLTISIKRNSDGDYIEMKGDGNGTEFDMVMPEGMKQIMKKSVGDQQVYLIMKLRLSE